MEERSWETMWWTLVAVAILCVAAPGRAIAQGVETGPGGGDAFDAASSAGEESADVGVELDQDSVTFGPDSLTAMESWAPPGSVAFKTAAACRRRSGDWFGVAAVFTVEYPPGSDPVDMLYYFVVDGWESSGMFGKKVAGERLLDTRLEIRNVHCTSDRDQIVFVAWDRVNEGGEPRSNGRMVALNFLSDVWPSPAEIGSTYLCHPGEDVYASRPRIAFRSGLLAVASNQFLADGRIGGSGIWWETFEPANGNLVFSDQYWPESCAVGSWDIQWNGSDRFVLLALYTPDTYPLNPWDYLAIGLDANGHETGEVSILDTFPAGEPRPSIPVLVYSANPQNTAHLLHMRNASKSYWLLPHGELTGSPIWYTGARTDYTGCEYWGTSNRLAHSFTNYTYNKKANTRHMHWSTTAGSSPQESYLLFHESFVPVSCASAERQDLYDDELLLVSRYTGGATASVYWSMESEH